MSLHNWTYYYYDYYMEHMTSDINPKKSVVNDQGLTFKVFKAIKQSGAESLEMPLDIKIGG
jgi:hypothetical protein